MSLEYTFDDEIAQIHFDDGKANAFRTDWFKTFQGLLDRADKDGARGILLRGRTGMFSGGLDVKWLPTLQPPEAVELIETFSETMLRVWSSPIPTVAEITGHAVAGGCVLASACDRRIALDGPFRLHMNEVLVKMAIPSWARAICETAWPVPVVDDLLLLAQPYSPAQAHALGAVHELAASPEELHEKALAAARAFQALDPRSFAASKERARGGTLERLRDIPPGQ